LLKSGECQSFAVGVLPVSLIQCEHIYARTNDHLFSYSSGVDGLPASQTFSLLDFQSIHHGLGSVHSLLLP
jgi:hypothetical protein